MKYALVFLAGCGSPALVIGNNEGSAQPRSVKGFSRVDLEVPVDVSVKQGEAFSVIVSIDSNLQKSIATELSGDTLVITSTTNFISNIPSSVAITMPAISSVIDNDSGEIDISGFAAPANIGLTVSSTGSISFTGAARTITASLTDSSTGSLTLSGQADTLTLAADDGTGELHARALTASVASLVSSGTGSIDCTVTQTITNVADSGTGNVDIYGGARVLALSNTGTGSITQH